jgi:hypothetical protein
MKTSASLLRLVIIAIVVLALGGLAGWYYFLRGSESQTSAQDTARGYGSTAPSFEGSAGSTNQNVISTLGEPVNEGSPTPTARLWEVSQVPVAGFGWVGSSTQPMLYLVERSSGNVLEANTNGETVMRLTDTLRPKIYQALVSLDGSVLERSIDDSGTIITFTGIAASSTDSTSTPDSLVGSTLPQGITAIGADRSTDTLYFALPGASGISVVSTNWSGAKQKTLFTSSIEGWRVLAPGGGTVVLLQDPLDGVTGYAYAVQKTGALSLLAEAPGLTVLPRSSGALLFGSSLDGTLYLYAQSTANGTPSLLSIQTIADKCAWAPGAALIAYCAVPQSVPSQQFLDDWYKGIVHTSDQLYEVDASAASTTLFYDPQNDTSAALDVEDMSVDPSGQYIAFINAADQSLWVLRIAQ